MSAYSGIRSPGNSQEASMNTRVIYLLMYGIPKSTYGEIQSNILRFWCSEKVQVSRAIFNRAIGACITQFSLYQTIRGKYW